MRLAPVVAAAFATARAPLGRYLGGARGLVASAAAAAPRITQDRAANNLITIAPADSAAHSATFVGPIHGLGDTNLGWADLALQLHAALPHVKFVLPNAPTAPVTLNGGMNMPSWCAPRPSLLPLLPPPPPAAHVAGRLVGVPRTGAARRP
jgi:hypothetical protein